MVFLSRIYTRAGDDGYTMLGDGDRVCKDALRVEAYGMVDELNAALGVVIAYLAHEPSRQTADNTSTSATESELLQSICNDLFDLGADLCVPRTQSESPGSKLRLTVDQVTALEELIDHYNAELTPLHSFVIPGGTLAAAWCHLARTICRRAERRVVSLGKQEHINPQVLQYLNRLSDLLFVLARWFNHEAGQGDVLWQPGQRQQRNKSTASMSEPTASTTGEEPAAPTSPVPNSQTAPLTPETP